MKETHLYLPELDACTRCGECNRWCETYEGDDLSSPQYRLQFFRRWIKGERLPGWISRIFGGGKPNQEELRRFASGAYGCTLCARCVAVCPARINLLSVWMRLRERLVMKGSYPEGLERANWVEFLPQPPEDLYLRERAETIYFVGCMASFFPGSAVHPRIFRQTSRALRRRVCHHGGRGVVLRLPLACRRDDRRGRAAPRA